MYYVFAIYVIQLKCHVIISFMFAMVHLLLLSWIEID